MSRKNRSSALAKLSIWILAALALDSLEIVEHARADEPHDQPDDRDDDQHLDQREAAPAPRAGAAVSRDRAISRHADHRTMPSQPTIWLTDSSAVITDTIRPPTMMLMAMIAAGPTMPTTRSRLRCSLAS